MNVKPITLVCPWCRGELRQDGIRQEELVCSSCEKVFPVIAGIPDLRVFPDPYIDIEADRQKGLRVAERMADLTFAELIQFYYSITPVVSPEAAQRYMRGLLAAPARAEASLAAWEGHAETRQPNNGQTFLEIGCGTAPLLLAAQRRFHQVIGVDISFRWLVVGKKRLAEAGMDVPLICACAEALPLADVSVDRVASESVIEHVRDQSRALQEAARVLRPGGRVFLSTPNAFSLGPDPQLGIWAAGYLPWRWLEARVRKQGGLPPKRKLLSVFSLRRRIRQAGLQQQRVFLPDIPAGQRQHFPPRMRRMIDLYQLAKRMPVTRHLLYLAGPLLFSVSRKPEPARQNSASVDAAA
jgi:SAM-dependent methyltransferase/uncharacterized protein YbaR (Trm112 family)